MKIELETEHWGGSEGLSREELAAVVVVGATRRSFSEEQFDSWFGNFTQQTRNFGFKGMTSRIYTGDNEDNIIRNVTK